MDYDSKLEYDILNFNEIGDLNLYNFSVCKFYNLIFLIGGNIHNRNSSNKIYEFNLITKNIKIYEIPNLFDSSNSTILYNSKEENFYILNFGGFRNDLKIYNREINIFSIKEKFQKIIFYSNYLFSDNIFSKIEKNCIPYLKKDFFSIYCELINKIIFVGGWNPLDENDDLNNKELEVWLINQYWIWERKKLNKFISNRRCLEGAIINEYLYLFGGAKNEGSYLNDFFRINILDFSTEILMYNNNEFIPEPRIGHSLNNENNKRIWLFGGIDEEGVILDNISFYDINMNKWFFMKNFDIKGRIGSKMIIENNNILIIGGLNNEELYTKKLINKINNIINIKLDKINNKNNIYKNNKNCIIINNNKFNIYKIPKFQLCECEEICEDNFKSNKIQSDLFKEI